MYVNNNFVSCDEVNVYIAAVFIFMQCKMFIIKCVLFKMRWVEDVACMGKRIGAYRVLTGKPEGTRTLGKPRPRWDGNIKMDL